MASNLDYNQLKKEYETLEQSYNTLQASYNKLETQFNQVEDENKTLTKNIETLNSEIVDYQTQLDKLTQNVQTLTTKNNELTTLYNNLQSEYDELTKVPTARVIIETTTLKTEYEKFNTKTKEYKYIEWLGKVVSVISSMLYDHPLANTVLDSCYRQDHISVYGYICSLTEKDYIEMRVKRKVTS